MSDKAKVLTRGAVQHGARDGRWSPATHLEILATLDALEAAQERVRELEAELTHKYIVNLAADRSAERARIREGLAALGPLRKNGVQAARIWRADALELVKP